MQEPALPFQAGLFIWHHPPKTRLKYLCRLRKRKQYQTNNRIQGIEGSRGRVKSLIGRRIIIQDLTYLYKHALLSFTLIYYPITSQPFITSNTIALELFKTFSWKKQDKNHTFPLLPHPLSIGYSNLVF